MAMVSGCGKDCDVNKQRRVKITKAQARIQ